MLKIFIIIFSFFSFIRVVYADSYFQGTSLPANPWNEDDILYYSAAENFSSTKEDAQISKVQAIKANSVKEIKTASISSNTTSEIKAADSTGLRSDPWSNPYNTGDFYEGLDYIGKVTTYTKAQGQRMLAPEINKHNLLVMTNHLRAVGYQIPTSVDDTINNAPMRLKAKILACLNSIMNSSSTDPITMGARKVITKIESETGLSTENILSNSLRILDTR